MGINLVEKLDDQVKINHVLLSVSNKEGLEVLVPALRHINPGIRLFSTGGTHGRIREILGDDVESCLTQVAEYTGQPETQGGLVKTLDFKIYLGLLTETYNDAHQSDLKRTGAVAIDMVVVNLYPFQATVAEPDVTVEKARGNIDIGGPCMIRAAAKNYIRVAAVVDPRDYSKVVAEMEANDGRLSLETRFSLAQKAFEHTARYDRAIADYLGNVPAGQVGDCYAEVI